MGSGRSLSRWQASSPAKTLEALLEDTLNRAATTPSHRRFEILNFSVGAYGVLNNVAVVDKKVFQFSPNAVLLVVHSLERSRLAPNPE